MRGVSLFMLIVALPALAALGHDIWLFYDNYGLGSIQRDLETILQEKGASSLFAALGFIWTQYCPDSYAWTVENTAPETWALISEFLTYKAFFVAAAFAGAVYILLGLLKLLGVWPFAGERQPRRFSPRAGAVKRGGRRTGLRYKRK